MEETSKAVPGARSEAGSCSPENESDGSVSGAKSHLVEFASTKRMSLDDIHSLTPSQLGDFLQEFYCKKYGKLNNPAQDLKNIRLGLQSYFFETCNIDIINGMQFENANSAYDIVAKGAPRKCNRMRIPSNDLETMYLGAAFDTDAPETLQNKVFFDINLYICNKGKEVLRLMKKNDFEIGTDSLNRKFVYLKLNPKFGLSLKDFTNSDRVRVGLEYGERMYERRGDPRCPVASFLKYHSHLHPMCDFFWQRSKRNVDKSDYVWYDHNPLGNNTLSKMMQRISQAAGLADIYTNFSIRSSYIAAIELMCQNAMASSTLKRIQAANTNKEKPDGTRELYRHPKKEFDDSTDGNSVLSESTETDVTDPLDDVSVGMKEAQSKVLNIIQGLKAKDLQGFIDWLMTFKLKRDNAGLIITCQPVEQPIVKPGTETMNSPQMDKSVASDSNKPEKPPDIGSLKHIPSTEKSYTPAQEKINKIYDVKPQNYGISIQQVEFETINNTHCSSTVDILPMKVVSPTQDTLLISGIQNNVQFLLHNKKGDHLSEELHSRVYYSEHNLDVAEVAALASYGDSSKSYSHTLHSHINGSDQISKNEKSSCSYEKLKRALSSESHLEEKFAPPLKKRFHASIQGYLQNDSSTSKGPVITKPGNDPLNLVLNTRR